MTTEFYQWLRILSGSILSGIGLGFLFSGVPEALLIGGSLLMIGLAFYIKGMKEYLKD